MKNRFALKFAAACTLAAVASLSQAQDIKIANIVELSGPGTTSGTMFKNGVELAIKEINAKGGILGKKIASTTEDTQTNPGVAKGLKAAVAAAEQALEAALKNGAAAVAIVIGHMIPIHAARVIQHKQQIRFHHGSGRSCQGRSCQVDRARKRRCQ